MKDSKRRTQNSQKMKRMEEAEQYHMEKSYSQAKGENSK